MTERKRKSFTSQYKTKVAVEAIRLLLELAALHRIDGGLPGLRIASMEDTLLPHRSDSLGPPADLVGISSKPPRGAQGSGPPSS